MAVAAKNGGGRDEEESRDLPLRLSGEALGCAVQASGLVFVAFMTGWTAAAHPMLPFGFQAILYMGLIAATMANLRPVSGGFLNPLLVCIDAAERRMAWREAAGYGAAQVLGVLVGCAVTTVITGAEGPFAAAQADVTPIRLMGEWLAAMTLIATLMALRERKPAEAALGAGAVAALFYGMSGGAILSNPAMTVLQGAASGGIRPDFVGPILLVQFAGAFGGMAIGRFVWR
jgi:glycerol uptake facilitator-like aquaporin